MRLNFITPKWAWPTGGLDKLLSAAVAKDYDTGLGAAKAWFATTDIDHASHAEHRLLAAVSHRYGSDLSDLAEYPRLQGMQRMLWAKALIASKEVKPAIKMVVDAGIDVMLLKGAARTAMDESAFKTRISYDVDLLVRPEDFELAFQMLTSAGWTPSSGESNLCIARGLPGRRSVNMFSGHFGDIDLHQFGYGPDGAVSGLEQGIWDTAPKATYFDVPVLIPCPEHAVAMAITHSGRDGHRHSDWVVDCATYTQLEGFDWSALRAAIQILGQGPIADATFGYLRDKQGLSVPARPFSDPGLAATVRGIPDLIQAKPRANHTNLSRAARWIVKQLGFDRTSDNKHRSGQIQGMLRRSTSRQNQNLDPRFEMALLDAPTGEHYAYDIEIMVPLNGHRRRLEFELNSAKTHYKRLRARNWLGLKGNGTLRFRGHLDVAGDPSAVRLVARPTRNLRSVERDTDATRYSAIPFQITRQTFTRIDRTKTSNAPQGSRYAYKREGKKNDTIPTK